MADTLLINYKPSNPEQTYWVIIDENGAFISPLSSGGLADITEHAKGRMATVLIDASCVTVESVTIPSNNRQRQLQAVPFALEDNLASDVNDMYFALGKKQIDGRLAVITINRQQFETILEDFRLADIKIQNLSAETIALPEQENCWSVLIDEEGALIKTNAMHGHYCDRANLPTMLSMLLKQNDQPPESIQLLHRDTDTHAADLVSDLGLPIKITPYADHPLTVMAKHLANLDNLNLLQGNYSPKRESSTLFKPWKAVAMIAGVWLVLQLIYAGVEINQLNDKNQQLTTSIEKAFKQANPGTKKYNNMQKRMERKLKELKGGGAGSEEDIFLELMADAAPSLNDKTVTIGGMVYNNKRIDIELQASSLQQLEAIKTKLSATRDLKITLSTSVEKDKVKGRLRLERQS